MLQFVTEKESVWDRLKAEKRPIYLYGMGDGAVRILSAMRSYGIRAAGIFASDEFVRGHDFAGYPVRKLSELESELDDFVIVLAFAVCSPQMIDRPFSRTEDNADKGPLRNHRPMQPHPDCLPHNRRH